MIATWALINELIMIVSAVTAIIGWYFIRRKKVEVHRRFMLTAATMGAIFFVSYLLQTVIAGDAGFGGPKKWAAPYQVFLQVHVLLATVAAVLGVITIRLALKQNFGRHRRVAPSTAVMWIISAATGLVVYLLLFVVFKPGSYTGNLLTVLFGHGS